MVLNEARARQAEDTLAGVLSRHLDRTLGVILARARGPKARRGTKWWVQDGLQSKGGAPTKQAVSLEFKAMDPDYVVPGKLTDGLADDIRPAATLIAEASARDTARRLGDDAELLDHDEIARAVDEAIRVILGVADRHAREVRDAVLAADTDATDLDNLLERIEQAHRRGGNWVLMAGRTLANALANASAYAQALRAGCTHAQWVSRRDGRVRRTHVVADGQVRRMGKHFRVGDFGLIHPGDPTELPESWGEIAGCRCGLLFHRPDQLTRNNLALLDKAATDPTVARASAQALIATVAGAMAQPDGPTLTPTPDGFGLPPAAPLVTTETPVVASRAMTAPAGLVPGQRIRLRDPLVLDVGVVARRSEGSPVPGSTTAGGGLGDLVTGILVAGSLASLIVLVPAGVAVAYADGMLVLPAGAVLEVLATGAGEIRARLAVEPSP
ncbi:MAG: hypothetical protein HOY78_02500 [Saccharothrix sp.]|nr:hypothetical protein [Saccharothrix sp.]